MKFAQVREQHHAVTLPNKTGIRMFLQLIAGEIVTVHEVTGARAVISLDEKHPDVRVEVPVSTLNFDVPQDPKAFYTAWGCRWLASQGELK